MNSRKINNPHSFSISMIFYGIMVGILSGTVTVLYRLFLNNAESFLYRILNLIKGHPLRIAGWFIILVLLGLVVGQLIKWEPMSSSSGIPQVQGEMKGYLNQNWLKVLIAKVIGGTLSILGGLSLGREGPSIQLGAMVGKGLSKVTKAGSTNERFMTTCGSAAGLAAAFNAPLSGVMFALEEIQKNFNASMLICIISGAAASDFVSKNVFGLSPVFDFPLKQVIALNHYWLLILLGLVLGLAGAFYNVVMLKGQIWYASLKKIKEEYRIVIAFLISGIVSLVLPQVLCSGHSMIHLLAQSSMTVKILLILLTVKFLFSVVSFGSGAPGGIFFPMLVLGAYAGALFGTIAINAGVVPAIYMNNFILLSMAGLFSAITRAPMTGILLIVEMSGSFEHFLSLTVVAVTAYGIAHLTGIGPIYQSLLGRILAKKGLGTQTDDQDGKVLTSFYVGATSIACHQKVKEVDWPDHCLIVIIRRDSSELIAKGSTIIHPGDMLLALVDENYLGMVRETIQLICGEIQP